MTNVAGTLVHERSLTAVQRKAIKLLGLSAQPIRNMSGIGPATIEKLINSGIVTRSGKDSRGDDIYILTEIGESIFAVFKNEMLFMQSATQTPTTRRSNL